MGRPLSLLAVIVMAAVAVAACSSGPGSTASVNASGNTAAHASTADTAASTSACIQSANAAVAASRAPITPNIPATPVDSAKNRGKTIWFISSTQQVPTLVAISQGVQAATAAVGMNVKIFDGAGNPALYNQGLTEAVNQHADGIILQGIDPSLVTGPLPAAQAAKIPTIDSMNGDPNDPLQNGISAHVTIDFTKSGQDQADYILAQTGCKADILELTSSLFVALNDKHQGFVSEIHRLCANCTITTEQVDFQSISTSVNSLIRAGLQRDPNINFVMASDDGIAFYAAPALQSIGSKVPVSSGNGVPADMAYVQKGQNQVVDVSFPPLQYIGWQQVDLLQRAMLGDPVPSGEVPQQLIDKTNLTTDSSSQFPAFAGYQQKYLKLWGLK